MQRKNNTRILLTLPLELIQRVDAVVKPGARSEFIREALEEKLKRDGEKNLGTALKKGRKVEAKRVQAEHKEFIHIVNEELRRS